MSEAIYRKLEPAEVANVVPLWVRVFGVEERFFTSLLEGGPSYSFGAWKDDQWVASVHVLTRTIRGLDGTPMKVGGLANVSTLPDYRQQGHSGHLIELALAEMEADGTVWSALGTGVNDHYARYGWRTVSTPYWSGTPVGSGESATELPLTDERLGEMASVHGPFTSVRPMAHVRSEATWNTALRYRLDPKKVRILGRRSGDQLVAYLVHGSEDGRLVEAAAIPGFEGELNPLFQAAAGDFRARGLARVGYGMPSESPAFDAFTAAFGDIHPGEHRGFMVRPIAGRISWAELASILGDARGRHSELDNF